MVTSLTLLITIMASGYGASVVRANFTLTVKFINYTNPSGLCAECNTTLVNTTLNNIIPVCCNGQTEDCKNNNTSANTSCGTRFRWRLREYGDSLETRPEASNASIPVYSFNPCNMTDNCPFEKTSRTFEQGEMAFLGQSNPNDLTSSTTWTGRIQFFIESVNRKLPNIIDSFLINLDTLKLGADFTEEMTSIGYHNISQMSMSFKVDCASNYYGPDCTTFCVDNPGVFRCRDSLTNSSVCIPHRDLSNDSTTATDNICPNSSVCIPHRDLSNDSTTTTAGDNLCPCEADEPTNGSSNANTSTEIALSVVLGLSLITIFVLFILLASMCFKYRKMMSSEGQAKTDNNMNQGATARAPTQDTVDVIELQPNILYGFEAGVNQTEDGNGEQTTDVDTSVEYDYIFTM